MSKAPPRDVTAEYAMAKLATARWDLKANFGEDKIDLPAIRQAYFEHGYVQALIDTARWDLRDISVKQCQAEANYLRRIAALEAALQQAISCIDPTDGARYEHAYVNGLHLLSARSGAETGTDQCVWTLTEEGDQYTSTCGPDKYICMSPAGMTYCPYCGKRVVDGTCSTFGGTREIDETLGGIHTSNPHAPCPDCTRGTLDRPKLSPTSPSADHRDSALCDESSAGAGRRCSNMGHKRYNMLGCTECHTSKTKGEQT